MTCAGGPCTSTTNGTLTIETIDIAKRNIVGHSTVLEWMQAECIYTQRDCVNGVCVVTGTFSMNCIDRSAVGDQCAGTQQS
ncbi:MAG: hypothetical protein K2Q09_00875 [Phycisphaerales bacterium]|nr:hypothetical protein [Phycisphaerales bacterium]